MNLVPFLPGKKHQVYWLEHGERGDPHEYFRGMDAEPKIRTSKAIAHFADHEEIDRTRGHPMKWDYEKDVPGEIILFKYKSKGFVHRFYAVIHDHPKGRRSVIVHGYKAPKSATKDEKDNPREHREKQLAEERVKQYLAWNECQGTTQ